jgi:predicted TIM-barrel fold metal-dependent hydrolase
MCSRIAACSPLVCGSASVCPHYPIDLHAAALQSPAVKFVLPHFSAGYFREALMLADLCPNVYLDTSSSNGWMRYEGLDLKTIFRRALDVVGPSRLLFGSDSSFFPRAGMSRFSNSRPRLCGRLA